MSPQARITDLLDDPITWDRLIDGELAPADAAALRAAIAEDPQRTRRFAARTRFLEGLAAAGAKVRSQRASALPPALERDVRQALTRPRARWVWAPRLTAAAVLLVGIGGWALLRPAGTAEALPEGALQAIDLARLAPSEPATGCGSGLLTPHHSAAVREGGYRVTACAEGTDGARGAQLVRGGTRPEDLEVVGWAARPTEGRAAGPDLGMTVLREHVVFDIKRGLQHEYMAVDRAAYADLTSRLGERASCFVCHYRSRDLAPNPHRIVQRAWRSPR